MDSKISFPALMVCLWTIIELSGVMIRKIAQKYKNVQKGVGGMMRGPMIETEARAILNQGIRLGINETRKQMALIMLRAGKLTIEEIAEYTELKVEEVEQLAGSQTI